MLEVNWRSSGCFLSPIHHLLVFLSFCLFVYLSFCLSVIFVFLPDLSLIKHLSSYSFILVHLGLSYISLTDTTSICDLNATLILSLLWQIVFNFRCFPSLSFPSTPLLADLLVANTLAFICLKRDKEKVPGNSK